jgi:hypothetical protein
MSGMNGVSNSGSMPMSCGMQNMHGGAGRNQSVNKQPMDSTRQVQQPPNSLDSSLGRTIDIRI